MSSREEEIQKLESDIEMYAMTEQKYDRAYAKNHHPADGMKADKYMQKRIDAQKELQKLKSRR